MTTILPQEKMQRNQINNNGVHGSPSSHYKVRVTIERLKNDKAAGYDELFKAEVIIWKSACISLRAKYSSRTACPLIGTSLYPLVC